MREKGGMEKVVCVCVCVCARARALACMRGCAYVCLEAVGSNEFLVVRGLLLDLLIDI